MYESETTLGRSWTQEGTYCMYFHLHTVQKQSKLIDGGSRSPDSGYEEEAGTARESQPCSFISLATGYTVCSPGNSYNYELFLYMCHTSHKFT